MNTINNKVLHNTIQDWCARNAHMLESLSPIDIVIAWEEYRSRTQPMAYDEAKAIMDEHQRQIDNDTFD